MHLVDYTIHVLFFFISFKYITIHYTTRSKVNQTQQDKDANKNFLYNLFFTIFYIFSKCFICTKITRFVTKTKVFFSFFFQIFFYIFHFFFYILFFNVQYNVYYFIIRRWYKGMSTTKLHRKLTLTTQCTMPMLPDLKTC